MQRAWLVMKACARPRSLGRSVIVSMRKMAARSPTDTVRVRASRVTSMRRAPLEACSAAAVTIPNRTSLCSSTSCVTSVTYALRAAVASAVSPSFMVVRPAGATRCSRRRLAMWMSASQTPSHRLARPAAGPCPPACCAPVVRFGAAFICLSSSHYWRRPNLKPAHAGTVVAALTQRTPQLDASKLNLRDIACLMPGVHPTTTRWEHVVRGPCLARAAQRRGPTSCAHPRAADIGMDGGRHCSSSARGIRSRATGPPD